ncbi:MAG: EAL domain-containing protein [Lachnospiraceae bacterium]|nr:EAL domain-containing protein [Lachnospiraceae bacterium]
MRAHTREKDKTLKPVFLLGTGVLVACILVCVIYIVRVQKRYMEDLELNFRRQMEMSGLLIEQDLKEMKDLTVGAAEELTHSRIREPAQIKNILQEYHYRHIMMGIIYTSSDETVSSNKDIEDRAFVKEAGEAFSEAGLYIFEDDSGSAHPYSLAVSAAVYDGDVQVGTVTSFCDLDETLNEAVFEFLRKDGDMFLVDEHGRILDGDPDANFSYENDNGDLFSVLKKLVKPTSANQQEMGRLKTKLVAADFGISKFEGEDDTCFLVFIKKVQAEETLFILEFYPEQLLEDRTLPLIWMSIGVCTLVVLMMTAVIVFTWYYMRRSSDTIRRLAYEDPTTKGMNFNYFLDKAILIIKENQELPFIVQRFDIFNFRYINEAYGHTKADELLAIVIMESKKVFNHRELCVRMNADQFVVLAVNSADYLNRFAVFEDNVNMRALDIGIKFPIRFKCGLYQVRRGDYDINVMVDRANVARKSLTADSKELYAYYSDRIINNMRKIEKIESEQQKALINGEFKIYLQPKWDINKDQLYGAEALVRWIREDGNMVYPDTFIPIFETNGFIEQLDFYMLEQVCAQIKSLLDEGKKAFPISVNQSRRLWDNPEYVANVERILKKYEIPSHYIDLEVTETVFFGERDKMIEIITQLKKREVLLSMDDFGSGYSSLNLLKDIPFDILKIDRDFFSESITSKSSTWILRKIVEMAEGLGIRVLCEGVETVDQVQLLKDIGCQYVQGYFYSKPLPLNDFIKKYVS